MALGSHDRGDIVLYQKYLTGIVNNKSILKDFTSGIHKNITALLLLLPIKIHKNTRGKVT